MRISLLAGAIALLAATTAAHAGTHVGWYVAVDAGIHQPSKLNLTIDDVSLYSRDFDQSTDPEVPEGPVLSPAESKYSQGLKGGAAGFLRGGYQFTPHWRVEAELGDRESKIKRTLLDSGDNDSGATGAGHVNIGTAMVNVLYDFAPNSKIDPFVGLGAGQAHIKSSYRGQVDVDDDGDTVTTSYRLNNNARNSAWQFLAGFSWALSDRLNLDVTYRYLDAGKMKYKVTANATYTAFDCNFDDECCDDECCDGPCNVQNQSVEARNATVAVEAPPGMVSVDETDIITASTRRLHDQSLSVGLRWAFAAPPPPAPIVSAAAPRHRRNLPCRRRRRSTVPTVRRKTVRRRRPSPSTSPSTAPTCRIRLCR
ncbi:MAG: porin family protein [Asticcacaulis sp.]